MSERNSLRSPTTVFSYKPSDGHLAMMRPVLGYVTRASDWS
jgi:hypothetical protein